MAGALDTYNADIMAITCCKCAAPPRQRCFGRRGNGPSGSHQERRQAAGWKWNPRLRRLERLDDHS